MMRRIILIFAVVVGCMAGSLGECRSEEPGRWQLGFGVARVAFDTDAPIRDLDGLDDDIESTFGGWITFGYSFSRKHSVHLVHLVASSSGEDMGGDNHFAIDTRYDSIAYYRAWPQFKKWIPYANIGGGGFWARARETAHPNFSGTTIAIGGGVAYVVAPRASITFGIVFARVFLDGSDALQYSPAIGTRVSFGGPPR